MKKTFKIILSVALALSFVGCDDEDKNIYPPAPVPPDPHSLMIGCFDNEGNNLLSESAEGNWLYTPISLTINNYPKNIDWNCFRPQQTIPWVNIDPATGAETTGYGDWGGIIRTDWNDPVHPSKEMIDSYAIISFGLFPDEKNDISVNFLELNQVVHIEFGSYLADRKSPDGKKYSCYVNGIGAPVDNVNHIIPLRIVLPHRAAPTPTE